ncbi:efflux RND transporter permease subunit [Aliikangiella sp. IMCC44359]|uniref:efflux RND transporter permease subunit n=1 Tax=Aliikangiella sp. IMCC44359 TaxID=3459125 RepID=UPI00403B1DE5
MNFNLGEWVLDNKRKAVTLLIIILLASIAFYPMLRFDNTPDSFFIEGDPTLEMYNKYKETFGSDEYSFIVIDAPDNWTVSFINKIKTLTESIESLDAVTEVTSITNVRYIQGLEGTIDVSDFLASAESFTEKQLLNKRQQALEHPFYNDLLISADGTKIGLLAQTELRAKEVMYKIELAENIRNIINSDAYSELNPVVVGAPIIDADVFKIINTESAIFGSLSFLIVGLGFFFIFRSWMGTILPLTIATLSIMVAVGLMGMMGAPAGLLTPIMPGFLMSVGVGSTVFLLMEIYQRRLSGKSLRESIAGAYSHSAVTSILSVATTAGALFTFSWSKVKPVEEIGLIMGGGLVASVILALLLIPLALSWSGDIKISERLRNTLTARSEFVEKIAEFVYNKWKLMLLLLAVFLGLSAWGITKLSVDYYYIGLFKEDTNIFKSYKYVDKSLRGAASMEVIFDVSRAEGVDAKSPILLKSMASLQRAVEKEFSHLGLQSYSAADLVKEINQALNEGDNRFYKIPGSRKSVAEVMFLYESSGDDELEELVSADYKQARVNLRLKYLPESSYAPLYKFIDEFVNNYQQTSDFEVDVNVTGVIPLWSALTKYLYETELQAILLSALVVLCVMVLVFRSFMLGTAMMFCNLIPVLMVLGAMGFTGIFIDPFTLLVSAIAIGMLDDDTIHFVRGFLKHLHNEPGTMLTSLKHAYTNSGQAMIFLSIVLVAGFLVYNLSGVASLAKFGTLTALAIGIGACCEFLFTPAVLVACEKLGIIKKITPFSERAAIKIGGRYEV